MLLAGILDFIQSLGHTSTEVHEWQEADVRMARLPNSPDISKLTTKRPDLNFSGWSLAHAVVKADYLDRRNLAMPGLGFLLQAGNLIDFGNSPIELKQGASKALNDVSLTSLSGRVGQGLAILYGHSLGMKFTAHLRTHVEELPAGSAGATHKDDAMADFLFANKLQTVLVEAKGSFTLRENDPTSIKSVLKRALKAQIDPWMGYLQPVPSNGYVVYACLREKAWAPSALFVVDPDGEQSAAADVHFPPDQVMRENYRAWLQAMGLVEAAERLVRPAVRSEVRQPAEVPFLIFNVDGRDYAFREEQFAWLPFRRWHAPAIGIDLLALQAISKAIEAPEVGLAEMLENLPAQGSDRQDAPSIFPDGSIFGPLDLKPFDRVHVRL